MTRRGIIAAAGYVPHHRLQRAEIAKTFGAGGGKGTRSVASYDEDTTTMGVEAARLALRAAPPGVQPAVWFSTSTPAYADKTNAAAIHAALRLDADRAALDLGGAIRSGVGALRAALEGSGPVLAVAADIRTGLPTGPDESAGGDAAAAVLVGDEGDGPLVAQLLAAASATAEVLDRWRAPGDVRSKQWEERFGETRLVPLGEQAWEAALKQAELTAADVDVVIGAGMHGRAVKSLVKRLGVESAAVVDDLSGSVGVSGTAHSSLLLAHALDTAAPGQVVALVALTDGADVLLLRTTDALAAHRPVLPVAAQVASAADVLYGKFLTWRGVVTVEPPRRPEPARVSASAASRAEDWKFAFVGSRAGDGTLQLPPAPDAPPAPMADEQATIATFTVDRLAYSPSPPIVFAIVDFDGGGRFPVELTDVAASDVRIGDRVEMTFRRLSTADGIHNYFWKARPVRVSPGEGSTPSEERTDG